jgi:DNA (cytosine-5)-methyltransferase 1
MDNQQGTDGELRELALFAGAGGGILAGKLLGWKTVCTVEIDPYAASVLVARQNDGILAPFPIWDDIRTFTAKAYRGIVDVVSGGFPCQDLSKTWKGAGLKGKRSGLWFEMCRVVDEACPRFVFIENVQSLRSDGIKEVWKSLAQIGYSCRSGDFYASDVGAPHLRKRTFILAFREWSPLDEEGNYQQFTNGGATGSKNCRVGGSRCDCVRAHSKDGWRIVDESWGTVAYPDSAGLREQRRTSTVSQEHISIECNSWWSNEPSMVRVDHGVSNRVDRLRTLGNAQVPAVARLAWEVLYSSLDKSRLPTY